MKNYSTRYCGMFMPEKCAYFVVYTGICAGCYSSHDEAYEAAWFSDELVREFSSLASAKYALKKFISDNCITNKCN